MPPQLATPAAAASGAPLLAVSYSGKGSISLFTEDGDVFNPEADPAIKHPAVQDALHMAWCPTAMLLAVGWNDGAVTLWNDVTRRTEETTRVHTRPITCLAWSSDGTRLVSGDEDGKLCIWTVDAAYRGIPVLNHHEHGWALTHLAIREDPQAADDNTASGGGAAQQLGGPDGGGFSLFYASVNSEGRVAITEIAEAGGRREHVCDPDVRPPPSCPRPFGGQDPRGGAPPSFADPPPPPNPLPGSHFQCDRARWRRCCSTPSGAAR